MKKIVLINQSSGYLFIDVVNAFAESYEKVVLLSGEIVPINEPLNSEVKVQKIFRYNRKTTLKRFFSWTICLLNIWWLLLFKYRKYELLISSNPPTASTILPLLFRRKITLLIYDIYPDGLVAGNFVTKNNVIYKSWAWLNQKAYKKANRIITLTPGMANAIEAYVSKEKIAVVPAWASLESRENSVPENENLFIQKYNLQGKFIVMYSGNLGKEYELEPLIYLAEIFKENKEIVFIIIGNGWKKEQLEKMISQRNLPNCMLLPRQPPELFTYSLCAFHLGVVSLVAAVSKVATPSKTYNLLAAQRPILCIGNEESDLANFLNQYNVGMAIEADRLDKMKEFIERLYADKKYLNLLCSNAGEIAKNYTKDRAKEIVSLSR